MRVGSSFDLGREEYLWEFLDTKDAAFSTAIIDAMFTNEGRPLWI
ncbi:hypothetical protein [Bradyrhizobium daqingense]|nr:hypothetical protein [Bradyrhizobium daqingense]